MQTISNAIKPMVIGCSVVAAFAVPRTASAQLSEVGVNIDWNDTHQTIEGFGGAQPGNLDPGGDYAGVLYQRDPAERSRIMDMAFSQASGIGLTILRSVVLTSLEPAPGAWNYSDPAQAWLMKEAVKRGPVKLIASVFSPPAWMKTNGSTVGGGCSNNGHVCITRMDCDPGQLCLTGALAPGYFQDFANYLSHYTTQYASANGVSIYAVSPANEPDIDDQVYDTCSWSSNAIAAMLGAYLKPTFASNHVASKLIAPETTTWEVAEGLLDQTYSDADARGRLDIVAGHAYGGDPGAPYANAGLYHKEVWQTEVSLRHMVWNDEYYIDANGHRVEQCPGDLYGKITCGTLPWAIDIHNGLTGAQISGWLWWVLALWRNQYSPIALNSDGTFSLSKTFWAIGNFSKFIRPGFVRIGSTSGAPYLLVSAYKDPITSRFAIVVINKANTAIDALIDPAGFTPGMVTPYITSDTENLVKHPAVPLISGINIPAHSIVTLAPNQPEIVLRGADGSVNLWQLTGGTLQGQLWTGTPDLGWTILGAGDFDGDGVSDLLWRCTGSSCDGTGHGQIAIWYRGQSTYPAPSYPGLVADDGWQVKGIGDFDGNGRSDVLWQYAGASGHGQLAIWYDGQSTSPSAFYPTPAVGDDDWRIQGIGDFDGNGRGDILWRYFGPDNHGLMKVWWNGQSTAPEPTNLTPVSDDGWQVKAIGDFDHNGRSDILWRYAGTTGHGQLAVWWNGQYVSPAAWYPGVVSDDSWQIDGVEDFDGDGRSDVLFQFAGPSGQAPHGQLAVWFGAQATNPPPAFPAIVDTNLVFQATASSGL